jgi:hypothetical protein
MSQLDINTLAARSGNVIHLSSHVSGSSTSTGSFGRVETDNLTVGGSQGSDGQVLTSTGTGVAWEAAAGGSSFDATAIASHVLPSVTDGSYDLGSATYYWGNVYTGDLNLSNARGDGNEVDGTSGSWTIQEGDENLFLINRETGKKFKFKLEEIE